MCRQVVTRETVYVFAEVLDDCFVGPSDIVSSEIDFFSFAALADFAFWIETWISLADLSNLDFPNPNFQRRSNNEFIR
jgi:hypothetical protein